MGQGCMTIDTGIECFFWSKLVNLFSSLQRHQKGCKAQTFVCFAQVVSANQLQGKNH